MKRRSLVRTLLCTASLICGVAAVSAQAMSLEEALVSTYKFNPTLEAERANLKATDENKAQANAGWLPTVTADVNRERENRQTGERGRTQQGTSTSWDVQATQPLFRGGETVARMGRADAQVQAGRQRLKDTEQRVLLQAITAYADVVRTYEVLKLSQKNEQVLKEQLDATKSRFSLGEATKTDVAQAESRLSRAQSDRVQAQGDLIGAKADFKRVVSVDVNEQLVKMPAQFPTLPENYDLALEESLRNNPVLLESDFLLKAAKKDVNVARADLLPDVSLIGRASEEDGLVASRGDYIESQSVLLNVSIPIFQSGAEHSRFRQSMRRKESVQSQLDEDRRNTEDQVMTSWKDVETTRATIVANQAAVDAAQVALEGVRQEHEVGARTVLDILDAEQELFTARVNLVSAKRNEVIAVYNLLASTGRLTADQLRLEVPLYDPKEHYNDVKYQFVGW